MRHLPPRTHITDVGLARGGSGVSWIVEHRFHYPHRHTCVDYMEIVMHNDSMIVVKMLELEPTQWLSDSGKYS